MKVGDRVTWKSQSAGVETVKIGTIVAIVPAGFHPATYCNRAKSPGLKKLLGENWNKLYSPKQLGGGRAREHESYLVSVPGKQKGFLYWPIVSKLTLTDDIEILAAYAHEAWSGWMRYLFSKGTMTAKEAWLLPPALVERWTRQMNTLYEDLPEKEKESDRKEAREILDLLGMHTDF